jgi:hypothetical protein
VLPAQLALLALAVVPGDPGAAALDAASLQRWRARVTMARSLVAALEGRKDAEEAKKGLVRELAERLEPIGSCTPDLAVGSRELLLAVQDLERAVAAAREEETWVKFHDWCLELGRATDARAEFGPHALGRIRALAQREDLLACPHLVAVLAASLPEGDVLAEEVRRAATTLLDKGWVLDGIGRDSACLQVDSKIGELRLHDWKPDHAGEVVLSLLESLTRRADGRGAIARLERKSNELSESAPSCEQLVLDQVALFQRLAGLRGSVNAPRLSIVVQTTVGRADPSPPGLVPAPTTPTKVLVGCQERPGEWTELRVEATRFPAFAALRYALAGDSGALILLPKATKKEAKEITVTIPEAWPPGYLGIIERANNQEVIWIRESSLSAQELLEYTKAIKSATGVGINATEDRVDKAARDQWKAARKISLLPTQEHWHAFERLRGRVDYAVLIEDVPPQDWNRIHDMVRTDLGSAGK